jgi:cytochrome c5
MPMLKPSCAVLAYAALLAACAPSPPRPSGESAPPLRAEVTEAGLAAYQQVCADCHETGRKGAPLTGQPEYWAGRSRLWTAVLFKHAEQGYLDMPARGGEDSLTDREVKAAAEYMLAVTQQ